jgi:hypothetical protein
VLVVCGRQQLEWEDFEKGMLMKIFISLYDTMSREMASELDTSLLRLIALRQAVITNKQDRSLLTLLNEVRSLHATNKLDKVYAIFGLTDTSLSKINLYPNYKITEIRLFTSVAKGIVLRDQAGLDILSVPRSHSDLSRRMPSWVPDWSHPAENGRPLVSCASRYGARPFRASGDFASPPPPLPSVEGDSSNDDGVKARLILQGYVFDRVGCLSKPSPVAGSAFDHAFGPFGEVSIMGEGDSPGISVLESVSKYPRLKFNEFRVQSDWVRFLAQTPGSSASSSRFLSSLFRFSPMLRALPDLTAIYAPTGEEYGIVCVRTLCADSMPYATEDMVRSFRSWATGAPTHLQGMWNQLGRLSQLNLPLPRVEPHLIDFGGMMEMMLGRRLMWSVQGYLGSVPDIAREGDAIALVHGCRVPLVLREADGGAWELVGDCYVHGIMYGERFESSRCGKIVLI